jgi:hypothetical protein
MQATSFSILLPYTLFEVSDTAYTLFIGALARTLHDNRGPVALPKNCWKAARELVTNELAIEPRQGWFYMSPTTQQ